jgi:hypothetical protein
MIYDDDEYYREWVKQKLAEKKPEETPVKQRKRNPIKPGRFWARSSSGVFLNKQRRKNNGYE